MRQIKCDYCDKDITERDHWITSMKLRLSINDPYLPGQESPDECLIKDVCKECLKRMNEIMREEV